MPYELYENEGEEKLKLSKAKRCWNFIQRSVEPVMFFYVLALQIQNPMLQQYSVIRFGEKYGLNASSLIGKESCRQELLANSSGENLHAKIRGQAASYQTGLMLFETIPSIVVCLFLGPLSDRIGRKPILTLSLLSSLVEATFVLLTIHFELPLYVIYFGSFVNGLGGYFTSLQMCMMAIIADVTTKENRYLRLGAAGMFAMAGGLCSNLISGLLISHVGYFNTYLFVTVSFTIALLYCILILKETHKKVEHTANKISILKYPLEGLQCLFKRSPRRWKVLTIFTAEMFNYMTYFGAMASYTLYAIGEPYCLSSEYVGYFLATRFACIGLGLPISLKLLRFLPDYGMAIFGLLSIAAGYVGIVLAQTETSLFLVLLLFASAAVPEPMFRAGLSKNISEEDQGKIFSLVASVEILFVFMGNFSHAAVYKYGNSRNFPGLTFLYGVCILMIPLVLTIYFGIRTKCTELNDEEDKNEIEESLNKRLSPVDDIPNHDCVI